MRRATLILTLLLSMLTPLSHVSAEPLRGDKDAIALAERMLQTLGGKAVWAGGRAISVELTGYYAREQEPWHEIFWMDLEAPRGRFELKGETVDRTIAWTPDGGWELNDGTLEMLGPDRRAFEIEYWRRQPVVIFHRLARGVPATRVEKGDNEFRFDVFDAESDTLLAQFAVNMKGEPIKWGSSIGEQEFEHFFGPLQSYGGLHMPKWGGSISAVWRYEHIDVALMTSQPSVSFEPPSEPETKTNPE
jgi:hypothetical protein